MAKLPKSIIAKYGISKRAWAEFRKGSRSKSRGTNTMARRKSRKGRRGSFGDSLVTTMVAAGVYGATREKISQTIQPFTSRIPILGNYSDEVVLGAAGYLLAKGKMPFFKGSMARSAGKAVLIIEAARVGNGISQGISFK